MVQRKTLLVRHLPPNLSDEEKKDLIEHFGAIQVKVISSKVKKSSLLFATYPTEEDATIALRRLHQLDVLGYPLSVEYAKDKDTSEKLPEVKQAFQTRKDEKENCQKHYENFLRKLNTWHSSVNFTQPPPAHLRYQYPPPTYPVLLNIMRALASVPKLYTQVLHLMNKMNLPSPFHCIFPEPDILQHNTDITENITNTHIPETSEETKNVTSTEESEIESEEDTNQMPQNIVPLKRTLPQKKVKVKRPKFVKPTPAPTITSKPSAKPEEVFEKVELEPTQRKIELILPPGETSTQIANPSLSLEINTKSEVSRGFGLIFPSLKDNIDDKENTETKVQETEETTEKSCITSQELAANRISPRDQKHLPVFKNYQPGIPSCRLYIKNLSKHVEVKDLHYIYSKYIIAEDEEQGSMFDIRLMQEGRMKGQAFVTLQSVKQAQLALNQTNGYILKDKPMVVQFARSAMAKT